MKINFIIFFSIVLFIFIASCKKHSCDVGIGSYQNNMVGEWQVGNVKTTFTMVNDTALFIDSITGVAAPNDTATGKWAFDGYFLNKHYANHLNGINAGYSNYDVIQMCPTAYQMKDDSGKVYNGTRIK